MNDHRTPQVIAQLVFQPFKDVIKTAFFETAVSIACYLLEKWSLVKSILLNIRLYT